FTAIHEKVLSIQRNYLAGRMAIKSRYSGVISQDRDSEHSQKYKYNSIKCNGTRFLAFGWASPEIFFATLARPDNYRESHPIAIGSVGDARNEILFCGFFRASVGFI